LNYNKIYWIVGGLPKYKDHFNLEKVKEKIIKAYIVGKNTNFFKKQIKNNIAYKISRNIKNAIDDIYKDLKLNKNTNSTILLSPAAASFDQFANFEKRGMHFKSLIIKKFRKN
jgi:UDP-N-acetylmuramoylalanine--D-glutamate ligase